jgi:hypothetical protein
MDDIISFRRCIEYENLEEVKKYVENGSIVDQDSIIISFHNRDKKEAVKIAKFLMETSDKNFPKYVMILYNDFIS